MLNAESRDADSEGANDGPGESHRNEAGSGGEPACDRLRVASGTDSETAEQGSPVVRRRGASRWTSVCSPWLDLLFPVECLACGGPLENAGISNAASRTLICSDCLAECLDEVGQCRRCGTPRGRPLSVDKTNEQPHELADGASSGEPSSRLTEGQRAGCIHCRSARWRTASVRSLGLYRGRLKQIVLRMKHAHEEPLSLAMGCLLGESILRSWTGPVPDYVVPIPSHWTRQWSRGTNPAALLGESVVRVVPWRWTPRLLVCRRRMEKQGTLGPRARRLNVRGALVVSKSYDIRGRRILVIDDVMTTGATANEAARALRQSGAAEVHVAVLARAAGVD